MNAGVILIDTLQPEPGGSLRHAVFCGSRRRISHRDTFLNSFSPVKKDRFLESPVLYKKDRF